MIAIPVVCQSRLRGFIFMVAANVHAGYGGLFYPPVVAAEVTGTRLHRGLREIHRDAPVRNCPAVISDGKEREPQCVIYTVPAVRLLKVRYDGPADCDSVSRLMR